MNENNQIIIYQTEDGQTQVDVRMENETVWLTTSQMAMLFDREESNIRRHVINVFKEGELEKENNVHFLHVNGVKKPVPFYNLDVIISVGYRVKTGTVATMTTMACQVSMRMMIMISNASNQHAVSSLFLF